MPLYALTIFCGAFLLFLVQPLMGKYLLPWFGGGPGVWTTCLVFFQTLLLGGYAYAHLLQRMTPRRQVAVHVVLLAASLAFLPIIPGPQWKPSGSEDPSLRILLLLTATLGLPYLTLSATGPLLQRWFSLTCPGIAPYRLYALSNAGSLLALVAYPFFFEPRYARSDVAWGWSAGLGVFVVLCGACAWRVRKSNADANASPVAGVADPAPSSLTPGSATSAKEKNVPTLVDRFLWFALPAVASVLLSATTNKLCLDIAAIPFLWVLPLGVYLVTFIICFDHPRWYARGPFAALLVIACLLLVHFLSVQGPPLRQMTVALSATLFVACMVCHGELYRLRPAPGRLTGYFLAIAAGGAAGSGFVNFVAPLLFSDYRELQLGLVLLLYLLTVICWFQRSRGVVFGLAAGLAAIPLVFPLLRAEGGETWTAWFASYGEEQLGFVRRQWPLLLTGLAAGVAFALNRHRLAAWHPRLIAVPTMLTLLLAGVFVDQARHDARSVHAAARNFYGAYKVSYFHEQPDPISHCFVLANGGTTHGQQFLHPPQSSWPTTYYSETSGLGRALAALPDGPRHIGAVGLGAGTIAAYGRPGDAIRFYEIDPAMLDVATNIFTYLKDTRADVTHAIGDARLVMERELHAGIAPRYDLLVLDAFSGDAIPVHLLTREAMALYVQQLRPGGMIAVHISNRHLDLRPVVAGLARGAGLHFAVITDVVEEKNWWLYRTQWVLLSADVEILRRPPIQQDAQEEPDSGPSILWTDEHASLLSVMK